MKKVVFSVIAAMLLLVVNSCREDFTNNPPLGAIDASKFFEEAENVDKAIIGVYDLMQLNYGRDWSSAFLVKILPGDDANAAGANKDDQIPLQNIDDYTNISSSNVPLENIWKTFYQTIALSNLIIQRVEEGDLPNKTAYIAEAKFMRAWSYFELTTLFGDIPLRTVPLNSPDDFPIAKSSRAEVYEVIEADLMVAINGLPDKASVPQRFRVSKGTAQAVMGKVLVYQSKFNDAIPYLSAVISNPSHDLEANVNQVWNQASDYGKQSLFEIGYISTEQYNWGGNVEWGGRVESNLHVQLMGPRGDGIFDVEALQLVNGWGFNLPTAKLVNAFNSMGDTVRKGATVLEEADLIAAGGGVNNPSGIWDYEGAIRMKYATRSEDTTTAGGSVGELNYTTNWRLMRYAEVLLLAAEAYNKAGQDGQARTELNKIRNRAGLADVSASGNDLFEAIVDEKFLELAHEGQRFWDLVRWGKASTELEGTGYSSKNDLFPIPLSEINLNDALTDADQNPGY